MGVDVLIFVEDPGAANCVAELPGALALQGITSSLITTAATQNYLATRGVTAHPISADSTAAAILGQFQPRLVLLGTSENLDSLAFDLRQEAKLKHLTTAAIIDSSSNAAYRFRGRTSQALAHAPDWLLVPDAWTHQCYSDLGFPTEHIVICGHPHYDYLINKKNGLAQQGQEELRQKLGLPPTDHLIVFVAEISTGLHPEQFQRSKEYTLHGYSGSNNRTDIVLEEFLMAVKQIMPQSHLILRLHPKNTLAEFTPYLPAFNTISQQGDPLELVYLSNLVVGMTSMLMQEAALLGQPTLAILPKSSEKTWLPTIEMGLTRHVTTRDSLQQALAELRQASTSLAPIPIVAGALNRLVNFIKNQLWPTPHP